jgi:uncharacterized protein with HEPN domain
MSRDWQLFYGDMLDFCQQIPEIPWQDIVGARNIFAHAYFGVDRDLIWHTVRQEIPAMLRALTGIDRVRPE